MAIGFLDDGVIHSRDLATHIENLHITLSAYGRAGLRLAPKKCSFFADRLVYLGHVLDEHGIRPPTNYIDAVKRWEIPRFKGEARAYLGVTGYYRMFIPDYAAIAKPWTDVIGKTDKDAEKTPLKVTSEMKHSFEQLKEKLTTAPILGFPYFSGEKAGKFTLDTDFSKEQTAGVLSQNQNGREVVLMYGSKKNSKAARNWGSTKGELYSGMYWMNRYSYYVRHREFFWRTDNSALRSLRSMNPMSGIIDRWLGMIGEFDFIVVHRAGVKHSNADGLSRAGFAEDAIDEETIGLTPIDATTSAIVARRGPDLELRSEQEEDDDLKLVRLWLVSNEPPSSLTVKSLSRQGKVYAGLLSQLSVDQEGIIRYQMHDNGPIPGKRVPCIPKSLWDTVMKLAHDDGGHMAARATLLRLRRSAFFPGMATETNTFVDCCLPCQAKQRKGPDQRHTLVSVLSGYPWQRLHLDFVGKMAAGKRTGAQWLLTVRDGFSRWTEIFLLKNRTAEATARALERGIIMRYGAPEVLHADMDKAFQSNLFKEVGKLLGITVTDTTGYHPASNGLLERMHRDLAGMLRAMLGDNPESWEDQIPAAVHAMNTAVHSATKLSPYQILFGRDVSAPLDLLFGDPNVGLHKPDTDAFRYVRRLRRRVDVAQKYARENMATAVSRQRRHYNMELKLFVAGQLVWLWTPASKPHVPRKLSTYWTGPWIVCATPVNDLLVRIAPHPSWTTQLHKKSRVVSIDRLKVYKSLLSDAIEPAIDHPSTIDDEFAEYTDLPPQQPRPLPRPFHQQQLPQQQPPPGPGPAPLPPPPRPAVAAPPDGGAPPAAAPALLPDDDDSSGDDAAAADAADGAAARLPDGRPDGAPGPNRAARAARRLRHRRDVGPLVPPPPRPLRERRAPLRYGDFDMTDPAEPIQDDISDDGEPEQGDPDWRPGMAPLLLNHVGANDVSFSAAATDVGGEIGIEAMEE